MAVKRSLFKQGLIGLEAEVAHSSDPTLLGVSGKIVDETRNMVVIEHEGKTKKIQKSISTFILRGPDGEAMTVNGKELVGRPEEQIRKR
ncbi:MAG: ribonuclease P protein subunit [Hadesarchaea archaeon]|nr:MAG: ribonuclease P protein subunit [Hadesarchaea archaeon]